MSNYFNKVPNFEYVGRLPDADISDYITVKNLFKKGALREDIFQDLAVFSKYKIIKEESDYVLNRATVVDQGNIIDERIKSLLSK